MEYQRPEILKGIELVGIRLISSEYQELKKPEPNTKGHVKLSYNHESQFKKKTGEEFPCRMVLKSEFVVQAFLGEENPTDNSTPIELASCRVKYSLLYKIKKPSYPESEYLKYQWFFQSHATILARGFIRDVLKDTDFSGMPLRFEITDETIKGSA